MLCSNESRGRVRNGVASTFLAERADKVPVPVYPSSAKHFHMPEDQSLPLIMIGPGTGIAPFRAFLQERQATGAKGKIGSSLERNARSAIMPTAKIGNVSPATAF